MAASTTDAAAAAPQWPDLPPELLREISGRLDAGADLVRFLTVCRPWRDAHADRPLRFPPWQDLPPGVLRNISGRLHAAADSVRFHAVCWPWRIVLDDDGYIPPHFLPWLLAPSTTGDDEAEDQRCRCIFSEGTYRAPGICVRDRRVAYANGRAAWLVREKKNEIYLVNPLTADRLPGGPMGDEWLDDLRHRIISRDGGVLLYDFDPDYPLHGPHHHRHRFRASFLRHGQQGGWARVSSNLSTDRCCTAAYYHGGYVVCVDLASCHVLRPHREPVGTYYYLERTREVRASLPEEPGKVRRNSYLVEYDGGLLLASVLQEADGTGDRPASGLSVSLHELRLGAGQNGGEEPEVEWVRRDESDFDTTRLGDDVLFLGFPGSFAVAAAPFGGEVSGGTAYFVIQGNSAGGHGCSSSSTGPAAAVKKPCSVFRYTFRGGVVALVETLPAGWHDRRCMWFLPRPKISRIPALRSRKCPGAPARIYAGDLSPKVDSYRLREMFSVYGKVASARVAYDKRGRSRGFGFVIMATQEGFDKAMAALNAVEEPDDSFTILDGFIGLLFLLLIFALFYLAFRGLRAAWFSFF